MTLENRKPGTKGPGGLAEQGPLVLAPGYALQRNRNITTWLFAGLSLFEGSPAIQSSLMAALLLLSGTALHFLKALIPGRRTLAHSLGNPRIDPASTHISREKCPAPAFYNH